MLGQDGKLSEKFGNLSRMSATVETNPFVPGFGLLPPRLAGRDDIFADLEAALARLTTGVPEQPRCLVGDRGYGKTAALVEVAEMATERGVWAVTLEAAVDARLVSGLVAAVRDLLLTHDRDRRLGARAAMLMRLLASLKVSAGLTSVTIDAAPMSGKADSGDLGADLGAVLVELGHLAMASETGVVILLDEIQAAPEAQLRPLLRGLQQANRTMVDRLRRLPITLVAAGLPHALSWVREHGGTYGERMRELTLGPLSAGAVIDALTVPSEPHGVRWLDDALATAIDVTEGYPYAVQLFGYEAWLAAVEGDVIDSVHAAAAARGTRTSLQTMYRSRFEALPDRERAYVRAMAALPEVERTSGRIAAGLGTTSDRLGSARSRLIAAGVIRADPGGRLAFTVPGMDAWVRDEVSSG